MVLPGLARKYADASSHVGPRLPVGADEGVAGHEAGLGRRRVLDDLVQRQRRRGHALDADEEDEDDGRGGEVHQRAGGDRDVALPDRLLVVDAVAGALGDLLLGHHAADLAEAAQRDDADAVLGLAPGAAQGGRREADVELLDAHAERLGGDEVAELVHGDEQGEAEDGDQPRPTGRAGAPRARAPPSSSDQGLSARGAVRGCAAASRSRARGRRRSGGWVTSRSSSRSSRSSVSTLGHGRRQSLGIRPVDGTEPGRRALTPPARRRRSQRPRRQAPPASPATRRASASHA